MSNALGISPIVMINRLVDQSGTTQAASLAKVAELRLNLMTAVDQEQLDATEASPEEEVSALPLSSGAVVDKLI